MKKFLAFSVFILSSMMLWAQEQENSMSVEMAEAMRGSGKIYVVISVLSLIFLGIVVFLIRTDKRVRKLENEVNGK